MLHKEGILRRMKLTNDRDQIFLSIAHELPRLRENKRYEDAIQWLKSLMVENTSDHELTVTAKMDIASCLMDLKRFDEAERLIHLLSSENLTREQVFHVQQLRVNLLEQTKKFEACIELVEKLLLDPMIWEEIYEDTKAELLSYAGFAQTSLGRYSDALRSFSDSLPGISKGERWDSILLYQVVCFRAINQPGEALTKVNEALTMGTGLLKGDFAHQQGLALKELGRNQEAQAAFRQAYADADFGGTPREDILMEMESVSRPS